MQRRKNKAQSRAQSFTEYAILIGLAVAVLIGIRVYMLRTVQEKFRQAADVFGQGEQYEKGVTQVTETGLRRE
mgnify:CR=1 FL=1